jgi:hypothetical protein
LFSNQKSACKARSKEKYQFLQAFLSILLFARRHHAAVYKKIGGKLSHKVSFGLFGQEIGFQPDNNLTGRNILTFIRLKEVPFRKCRLYLQTALKIKPTESNCFFKISILRGNQ